MGIIKEIPPQFYEPKFYNDLSLKVINCLNNSFIKCNKLLKKEGYNTYENLIGIFYHHLTRLLTSYIYCKSELILTKAKSSEMLKSLVLSNDTKIIWPVNYSNVFNSIYKPIGNEYLNIKPSSIMGKSKHLIKKLIKSTNIPTLKRNNQQKLVLLSSNSGFKPKDFIDEINCSVNELDLNTKAFIPVFNKQIKILYSEIKFIEKELGSLFSCKSFIDNNFLLFIEKELLCYLNLNEKNKFFADILVVGSLADLKSRMSSAIAKSNKIPVVSVWHGDTIGDKNEPLFGPVEQSFCDFIIGYGDYGCNNLQTGNKNVGLFKAPTILPATSININNLYLNSFVSPINSISMKNLMYVPTSFSKEERFGPYRDIHDIAYYYWQENLLYYIKKIMKPEKLIRKGHRKDKIKFNMNLFSIDQINDIEFSELLDMSNIFIFDYPTTAFAIAAATNKPIIYFDIGLRNLMPGALKSIKDRCIYIKGDPISAEKMVMQAFNNRRKPCKNTFTSKFSLSQNRKTQKEILSELIKSEISIL